MDDDDDWKRKGKQKLEDLAISISDSDSDDDDYKRQLVHKAKRWRLTLQIGTQEPPPPRSSRLDSTAREKVKQVVSQVKGFLINMAPATCDPQSSQANEVVIRILEMIKRLDKYVDSLPIIVTEPEMACLLQEFQKMIGLAPDPSWLSLMKISYSAFLDSLWVHFMESAAPADQISSHYQQQRSAIDAPDHSPYEKVKRELREAKACLDQLVPEDTPKKSKARAGSPSATQLVINKQPSSVEEVIKLLEDYLETVSRTLSEEDLEALLLEFQLSVGVAPRPSWYSLLMISHTDWLDSLRDYYVYHTVESKLEKKLGRMIINDVPAGEGPSGNGS